MTVFMVVWGPVFALGLFGLSEFLMVPLGLYIEHGLTNLYIPALIYGFYQLYSIVIETGEKYDRYALFGYFSVISTVVGIQA